MALAKILHQLLKDIWIPLRVLGRNDNLLQNVAAPLLSSVTSARSSKSPWSLLSTNLHSVLWSTVFLLSWVSCCARHWERMVSDTDVLASWRF